MSHPVVLAEFMEIEEVLRLEREAGQTSWAEMAQPRIAKRVFLGCSVQMFSQLTGMNVMSISPFHSSPHAFLSCMLLIPVYYIVYVMQGAGVTSVLLISSIQYVLNVVMTVPAIIVSSP